MPFDWKDRALSLPRANRAVADILREGIIGGSFAPGERLKEEEIAVALGVSRTPVREALLVLATERLVDLPSNRGARAVVRVIDHVEQAMIYDIRGVLETYAARIAAERMTPEILAALEASCDRLAALPADDSAGRSAENRMFHGLILDACGSERLSFIAGTMMQVPLHYKRTAWSELAFHDLAVTGHRRIVEALRSGDPDRAGIQMHQHIQEMAEDFSKRVKRRDQDSGY